MYELWQIIKAKWDGITPDSVDDFCGNIMFGIISPILLAILLMIICVIFGNFLGFLKFMGIAVVFFTFTYFIGKLVRKMTGWED